MEGGGGGGRQIETDRQTGREKGGGGAGDDRCEAEREKIGEIEIRA